jgi:hypothetical protein
MADNKVETALAAIQEIISATRTWPAEREPTAQEWAGWFCGLDIPSSESVAGYMLDRQREDAQCFLMDHVSAIRSLEAEIVRLRKVEQEVKGEEFRRGWAARNVGSLADDERTKIIDTCRAELGTRDMTTYGHPGSPTNTPAVRLAVETMRILGIDPLVTDQQRR